MDIIVSGLREAFINFIINVVRVWQCSSLGRVAVKALASAARSIAQDSVGARCYLFIHQPEEPTDIKKRLLSMRNID